MNSHLYCIKCGPGQKSPVKSVKCTDCDLTVDKECSSCQSGQEIVQSSNCNDCKTGTFSNDGIYCQKCQSGYESKAGSSTCTKTKEDQKNAADDDDDQELLMIIIIILIIIAILLLVVSLSYWWKQCKHHNANEKGGGGNVSVALEMSNNNPLSTTKDLENSERKAGSDWESHVDSTTGKTYYHNGVRSTWTDRRNVEGGQGDDGGGDDGGGEWVCHRDKVSMKGGKRKMYYINKTTGETKWE
jgi:hypothetical protein